MTSGLAVDDRANMLGLCAAYWFLILRWGKYVSGPSSFFHLIFLVFGNIILIHDIFGSLAIILMLISHARTFTATTHHHCALLPYLTLVSLMPLRSRS